MNFVKFISLALLVAVFFCKSVEAEPLRFKNGKFRIAQFTGNNYKTTTKGRRGKHLWCGIRKAPATNIYKREPGPIYMCSNHVSRMNTEILCRTQ